MRDFGLPLLVLDQGMTMQASLTKITAEGQQDGSGDHIKGDVHDGDLHEDIVGCCQL